jgi:hypothetical protein
MLSGKLVQLIETHWDQITNRVLGQIRRHPNMTHIAGRPDAELREWGQMILENLGYWLTGGHEGELARAYEQLGKERFESGVPLSESVQGLCLVRENVLEFLGNHLLDKTTLDWYAEVETDRRLMRFFDVLTVHLVRGYERALRNASALAMLP